MQASVSLPRRASQVLLSSVLIAIALFVPSHVCAQAYFGTVSGELTDASGAVIAGASVMLSDEEKGFNFITTSDNSGRYLFRSVAPGVYSVTAEAKGFAKATSARFKVDVNENATTNLKLKVGAASQTVEVGAQSQTIQTEDAETGQVVNRRYINDLPLIDRNIVALTSLAPGVTEMDDQCGADCTGTNFVSNGSRGSTSDILTDGASVTNSEPNGGITAATYLPSPEAVQEFKVQQTNFSAEYGFSGASVVNMITRSGTNQFHGSGYEFFRDDSLDANDWFANRNGEPIPPLRRNNFGFTFGGPIFKNKTFFFVDYDGLRSSGLSTSNAAVPTDLMRAGNFGQVCAAQGGTFDSTGMCSVAAGQIWDPYSGVLDANAGGIVRSTFIPNNNLATYTSPGPALQAPGNLIDPVAQKMMALFPEPNISGGDIYNNWFGSGASHGSNDQFDVKIDHRWTANNLMSGKFSYQYSPAGQGLDCFKNFTDPCRGGPGWSNAHLFAITDTHTFSPTLLLNATLGFTRGVWHIDAYNPHGQSDPLGNLGFPSYLQSNGFKGVPAIFIDQYPSAGYANVGTDPYGNYRLGQDTGQLSITLDKVHGSHELKFGFDGRIHQINYIQTNAPLGFFTFNADGSYACPGGLEDCGGDPMASFMMGMFTQGCGGNGCGSYYEIQFRPATTNYQYGFFVQDNWKATSKLTLNLGVRYDVTKPRTDRYNRQNWFDENVTSPLNGGSVNYTDPVTGNAVNLPLKGGEVFASSGQRTNYVTDWNDIQPRFGFAFQFVPKMVLRGGYGIYYGQSRSGVTGVAPYGSQGFNQFTNVITANPVDHATPYAHLNNPFPNGLIQPSGNTLGLMNDVGFGANGPLRTPGANQTPYEQSWSLGIERQLPSNILINAEYIGKKGTHLPFSGSNYINHLGPWVENLAVGDPNAADPCEALTIACLNTLVDNPFAGSITDPNSTLGSNFAQIPYQQLLLPHPQFTGVTTEPQLIGSSIYHGLQLLSEKKFSNGLQFLATYTWSKSIDNASQADDNVTWLGSFSGLQDPNKPWLERSLSTFDIPHVFQISYSYDLPFGRGRAFLGNMPRWADLIIGGWKTNGIWRIADGRPLAFNVADGNPIPTYGTQRPNIVGTPKRNHGSDFVDQYFVDDTVFQRPDDFTMGNAPRALGSVRSPWSFTANLSVGKQFYIREAMNFEVRLEAQNALNHPVFGTPNTSVDDENFGKIFYTSVGPRQVQLAFKFNF
ncbi:MAG TPA: carboxypeptidase regulatory-like domain-containing protein [Candidatus Sulfotelmatobacter sp.]|nr:carboxypeptidase regulatory-like domain-containing protein [Candidatus Sulfotelmatobacter sp.]